MSAHQKVAYACLRSFDEINIASGFVCSCRLLFDLSESWSQLFLLEAINGYYRIRWIGQSSIGNRCSVSSPDPLVGCIDKPNQMLLTASLFNFGSSLVVQPIVKPSTRFFNNRKEANTDPCSKFTYFGIGGRYLREKILMSSGHQDDYGECSQLSYQKQCRS